MCWQLRVPTGRGAKEDPEGVAGAGAVVEGAGAGDVAAGAKVATRASKLRQPLDGSLVSRLRLTKLKIWESSLTSSLCNDE